ncbi:unnamed protein product, partial [Sphagnum jensenii]
VGAILSQREGRFEKVVAYASKADDEDMGATDGKQTLQKGTAKYYDKRQQLELVLAAQELSEFGGLEVDPTGSGEEENCGVDTKGIDIWRDETCLELLKEGMLPNTTDLEEGRRARKRASNYCWKEQRLYFKGLADNYLHALTDVADDGVDVEVATA